MCCCTSGAASASGDDSNGFRSSLAAADGEGEGEKATEGSGLSTGAANEEEEEADGAAAAASDDDKGGSGGDVTTPKSNTFAPVRSASAIVSSAFCSSRGERERLRSSTAGAR